MPRSAAGWPSATAVTGEIENGRRAIQTGEGENGRVLTGEREKGDIFVSKSHLHTRNLTLPGVANEDAQIALLLFFSC
jgi:hypothetical protein